MLVCGYSSVIVNFNVLSLIDNMNLSTMEDVRINFGFVFEAPKAQLKLFNSSIMKRYVCNINDENKYRINAKKDLDITSVIITHRKEATASVERTIYLLHLDKPNPFSTMKIRQRINVYLKLLVY